MVTFSFDLSQHAVYVRGGHVWIDNGREYDENEHVQLTRQDMDTLCATMARIRRMEETGTLDGGEVVLTLE